MIKSRWTRILVKILLIALVITGYCYFQHPVIYRYRDVNAVIPVGDMQLIIDEINVHNWDEQSQYRYVTKDKTLQIPWAYRVLCDMDIPLRWKDNLARVISFYSKPALTQDYETLQVYGVLIYPEETEIETAEMPYDRIHYYVYSGSSVGGSGRSGLNRGYENLSLLSKHHKVDFNKMNPKLIVKVEDTKTSITTQIVVSPKWEKERLFKLDRNGNSPTEPAHDFLNKILNEKPKQALKNVLPERRKNFTIPELNSELTKKNTQIQCHVEWLDVYKDYVGVYKVKASLIQPDDSINPSTPVQEITFVTIKDHDGNYKIVNVW